MPLFEYTCEDCQSHSEQLIIGQQQPVCPECGGNRLRKAFSTFSTQGGEQRSPSTVPAASHGAGCGCCMGPQGSCGLN